MHSEPFGCLSKLGAKRAELVQKFEPRGCIRIIRNERTRSNPLDPKLTFWCVSYYLGAFETIWMPYETRWKTGRTIAKVRATKSRQNFSQRTLDPPHWTLNSRFSAFHSIWVHLGPFGCLTKLVAKRAELCKRLFHEVALEFFTTNAPDPPHWTLN